VRGVVTPAALLGVLVMVVAGSRTTSDTPPDPALEMTCDDPQRVGLGVPTVSLLARLTTSGGRLRFVVRSLPSGSIFGEINDTEVQLGDIDAPGEARYKVRASPQVPGVIYVEAGTYWVLNTNRGGIGVEVCPDVILSDVEPANRPPRGGSSTGSTPTPSGEPASPPSADSTPGTSPSGS
jgi:hypothetical protein